MEYVSGTGVCGGATAETAVDAECGVSSAGAKPLGKAAHRIQNTPDEPEHNPPRAESCAKIGNAAGMNIPAR